MYSKQIEACTFSCQWQLFFNKTFYMQYLQCKNKNQGKVISLNETACPFFISCPFSYPVPSESALLAVWGIKAGYL
jgi:hypothetical protein